METPTLPNGKPATWTILHYAAADNNLEDVLLQDINEMEAGHGGTSSVNVVVQLDRRSESGVWRYHVKPDSDRSTINSKLVGHSEEEPDSGDWRTLASFGQWAANVLSGRLLRRRHRRTRIGLGDQRGRRPGGCDHGQRPSRWCCRATNRSGRQPHTPRCTSKTSLGLCAKSGASPNARVTPTGSTASRSTEATRA